MEQKARTGAENFMICVLTISMTALIIEGFLLQWEFWVFPLILIALVALWFLYLTHRISGETQNIIFLLYGMVSAFYHGVHQTSFFDIAIVGVLMLTAYSLMNRFYVLNLLLAEYFILTAIQIWLGILSDTITFNVIVVSRVILHLGTVMSVYFFCRMIVSRRLVTLQQQGRREQEVENANRDMEDFLSNISHELRTPINVVNGMSQIFMNKQESDEVDAIYAAGLRLANQVEDIQDFTEIKRGEIILEEEKYMSSSLIHDVVVNYNTSERGKNLELIVNLDPRVPVLLQGDIRKLHKLFRHLLGNSLKFTSRGGVYVKIFAVPRDYGINLEIQVTDTGIGMTRKEIAKVSKGLYQANRKRNRSTGGIGIGLPIVYGFVHQMGGFVKIDSTRGVGTTVSLSIPQKVIDPAPCLTVAPDFSGDIIFFVNPGKYKVPALREFYKSMAVTTAIGLNVRLFSATSTAECDRLLEEYRVSHIFMGQEEFEENADYFEKLSKKGHLVAVSAGREVRLKEDSKIVVMPKPLYSVPAVQVLNSDFSGFEQGNRKTRLMLTGVRALVVDDEPMNLVVATGILREYRMTVDTAEGGKDALKKYDERDYDVIFMDHMMPEMDGVEAMKKLREVAREKGRKSVIVALTANALSGAREMFMREGFDGFIAKPIDTGEFERVMKHVLPASKIHEEGGDGE